MAFYYSITTLEFLLSEHQNRDLRFVPWELSFVVLRVKNVSAQFSFSRTCRKLKIIALMMEAVQTSETLESSCLSTWCYNPEHSHLHPHCHENLKSYMEKVLPLQE
jgi:hypothetical protein